MDLLWKKSHNNCGELLLTDKNINGKTQAPGNLHDALIGSGFKEEFF